MKLIDKAAVVTEIEKLRKNAWESFQKGNSTEEQYYLRYGVILDILSFIDTLEVKDEDLDEYINKYFKGWYVDLTDQGNILHTPDGNAGLMSVKEVARHFFELGMAASNKA